MMLKHVVLVGMSLGFCLPQVHAKNYYKWVDSKGNVTYSSKQPPAGVKQQKIKTIRSLGTTNTSIPKQTYQSNASIPDKYVNYHQSKNRATYAPPRQPERSAEDEALRQKIIKEASTPYKESNGRLTAKQQRVLAAMNGVDVPTDNSNSRNSYSAPAPQRAPSTITNCDSAGCWGTDGTRYDKGAGNTYFPSTGGSCQNISGQMQCN